MMESDLREAQMKRAMAETAAQKIALIDHAKFGHILRRNFAAAGRDRPVDCRQSLLPEPQRQAFGPQPIKLTN
jgi:hypothetical protein